MPPLIVSPQWLSLQIHAVAVHGYVRVVLAQLLPRVAGLNNWLIVFGLVVLMVVLALPWLRRTNDNRFFNRANDEFKQFRRLAHDPQQMVAKGVEVVRLCQQALAHNPHDGDAQVVLATTYMLLRELFTQSRLFEYFLLREVAVIEHWRKSKPQTHNQAQGETIYRMTTQQVSLMTNRLLLSPQARATLATIHQRPENDTYHNAVRVDSSARILQLFKLDTLLLQAQQFAYARQADQALPLYDQVLQDAPDDPIALYGRGMTHLLLGRHSLALYDLDKSIALNPEVALVYLTRALVYTQLQEITPALADVNQALTLEPHSASAYVVQGMIYFHAGQEQEAVRAFGRYLDARKAEGDAALAADVLAADVEAWLQLLEVGAQSSTRTQTLVQLQAGLDMLYSQLSHLALRAIRDAAPLT